MKNSYCKLLCMTFCAVLILGCMIGYALADKETFPTKEMEEFRLGYFAPEDEIPWLYAPDTLPDGIEEYNNVKKGLYFRYFVPEGNNSLFPNSEEVNYYTFKYVSGEETLKNIFLLNNIVLNNMNAIGLDTTEIKTPGSALFDFYFENENYVRSTQYQLNVLDYNEYPFFDIIQPDGINLTVNVGDTIDVNELADKCVKNNYDKISNELGYNILPGQDQTNKYVVYQKDTFYTAPVIVASYFPDDPLYGCFEGTEYALTVLKSGTYHLYVRYSFANICYYLPLNITTVDSGDEDSVVYNADSREPYVRNDGVLNNISLDGYVKTDGFNIPVPGGDEWQSDHKAMEREGYSVKIQKKDFEENRLSIDAKVFTVNIFIKDEAGALPILLADLQEDAHLRNVESELFDVDDGHPVLMCTCKQYYNEGIFYGFSGGLFYPRNNKVLKIWVSSLHRENDSNPFPASVSPVTMDDLRKIAAQISYDETEAPIICADGELTISAKDNPAIIPAGKNVQFAATFANPDRIKKNKVDTTVAWSVVRADTDDTVEGVSIDAKGLLKVNKNLAATERLQVKVSSDIFGSSATYDIIAMPSVSKVILDPSELFFYVGTEEPQTVEASLEPADIPLMGLTWTPSKKDTVEITEVGDGVVSIKPLKAGKTDIAVKEPGGKNAKLTVNAVNPVESVELKVNGKVKAGAKVNVTAALRPQNAGNKMVQWSVNVGEDIATISEKGQLSIMKEVPSGTKIVVTCTALGAPTAVTESIEIEVQ